MRQNCIVYIQIVISDPFCHMSRQLFVSVISNSYHSLSMSATFSIVIVQLYHLVCIY